MLFVGRASLTGKRIAAGHFKKLQFPRTRHSRDRIAERAIRGGAEKFAPCHQSLRQLPDVLFVGRCNAAGHIGKKLQFPRARRSRDRIAEQAIRGGGVEIFRPVIIAAPTSRARAFVGRASLARKRIAAGHIGKSFSFRARGTPVIGLRSEPEEGGLRNLRPVISRCATVGRASLARKRTAAGHMEKRAEAGPKPCYQRLVRFIKAEAATCPDRHPDLSCALQILYYPAQSVYQRLGRPFYRP